MKLTLILLALACSISCASRSESNSNQIFGEMEQAIRSQDEASFRKHWTDDAYANNLVGRGGLDGARLYQQGARKKWYPKPDASKSLKVGNVDIVATDLHAWESGKSVDQVYFAVAMTDRGQRIIGSGEDIDEVKKLAARFNAGESLEAKN